MSTVITQETTVAASSDAVSTEVAGEAVILDLDVGVYYGLNDVATRIWSLVAEPIRVREICSTIEREYDVEPDTCRADVLRLVTELAEHDLLRILE
jgi:Coenzyme PQQ synthesis protein D (PqqD)